jgi:hypothetical protein
MRLIRFLTVGAAFLSLVVPVNAGERPPAIAVFHDEVRRGLDELAGHLQGLGGQWRDALASVESGAERPLISIALAHRVELGLSGNQVASLERLRSDYQREAIRRDADLRIAEMDIANLRRAEPVDLAQVEARVREAERLRADMRMARIRTIEEGKAQLSAEQRDKLRALAAEPGALEPARPRAGEIPAAPAAPPRQRM